MNIWAIIPVKPLSDVKRRLAGVLSAEERAWLICHFLRHELEVLNQIAGVEILVVSSDEEVASLARQYGANVLVEDEADGLNAAVTRGVAHAMAAGASGVFVLPADLPFLTPEDVRLLLQTARAGQNGFRPHRSAEARPLMGICTDKTGDGTNALLLVPPIEFTFQYGTGSFRHHIAEAARRGLSCHIVSAPGFSFDLDTEADWRLYNRQTEKLEIRD